MALHEHALRTVHQSTCLQLVFCNPQAGDDPIIDGLASLGLDGPLLLAPRHGLVDRRDQLDPLEGLDQVGRYTGIPSLVDQGPLAERSKDQHGHLDVQIPDVTCGLEAVSTGHLHIENDEIGQVDAD